MQELLLLMHDAIRTTTASLHVSCMPSLRCMFVEHRPLQVSEFRDITLKEADRIIGHKGQAGSAAAGGVASSTSRRLESKRCESWIKGGL